MTAHRLDCCFSGRLGCPAQAPRARRTAGPTRQRRPKPTWHACMWCCPPPHRAPRRAPRAHVGAPCGGASCCTCLAPGSRPHSAACPGACAGSPTPDRSINTGTCITLLCSLDVVRQPFLEWRSHTLDCPDFLDLMNNRRLLCMLGSCPDGQMNGRVL